jgi:5-methylcytosine-specific restriction endonuclease McrA
MDTILFLKLLLNPELDTRGLEQDIIDLYGGKCVRCGQTAVAVHEMTPKSRYPSGWWKNSNRVPLCAKCHDWAHSCGTNNSRPELMILSKKRLDNLYSHVNYR